jgi:16S rRNA A1518/A1519 N6-dimethyltransferase RsmA/KsgA/DIM1 with predicted DNA glycosylase/AP lyase activity
LADAVNSQVDMKIFQGDALHFPFGQHVNKNKYEKPWDSDELPNAYLVGNLPFNIATPLLFKLLLKISDRKSIFTLGRVPMTFLFQQEFGERMICPPEFKDRSRVYLQEFIFLYKTFKRKTKILSILARYYVKLIAM